MLAYTLILCTALAGMFGASWWAAMVGGCLNLPDLNFRYDNHSSKGVEDVERAERELKAGKRLTYRGQPQHPR